MPSTIVGQVQYDVEIKLDQIQGQLTALDTKISTHSKSVSDLDSKINNLEKSYGLLAKTAGVVGLAIAGSFTMAAKASFNQVKQVENATFALRAYEKDAQAVNTVLSQLVSYARSDMGTLFQREELFQAAANLKGFGDATSDLTRHVEILSKGVALGMTNFDELSQIVGRSANAGKLTAIAFDQLASRGIILDQSFRGATVSADELFEAIDRAIDDAVVAGRADTIEGRLIKLNTAWRDVGAQILGVDAATSTFIKGGLGDTILNIISATTEWIGENKRLIIGVGSGVVVFGTLNTVIFGAIKAIAAIRTAMIALGATARGTQIAIFGIVGALSVIAGYAVGKFMESQFGDATDAAIDFSHALPDVPSWGSGAEDAIEGVGKQLKKLEEQSRKIDEDFRYNLAQLVQGKQENISKLQQTLKEQDKAYQNSYNSRLASFNVSQNKEAQSHSKRVKELQTQIDFLNRYNNEANQRKLSELQFALERENAEYQKQTKLAKGEFDAQTKAAKDEYEARRAENQKKLNEEMALLNKHRADVLSVRGVMLRDEIENLKHSRKEQKIALENQKIDILASTKSTYSGIQKEYDEHIKEMEKKQRIAILKAKLAQLELERKMREANAPDFHTGSFLRDYGNSIAKYGPLAILGKGWAFASGGYTGRGGVNDPAGIVHKGEYVLPQGMVNQATGTPDMSKLLDKFGGSGQTININLSGVFATSKQEQRKVADVIVARINETQRARGFAV